MKILTFQINTFINDVFDLTAFIGETIQLRFWTGVDKYIATWDYWDDPPDGWYIDDIEIISPEYEGIWTPEKQPGFGDVNDIISYDMTLKNNGGMADTFTFLTTTDSG